MKLSDYLAHERMTVSQFARQAKLTVSTAHRAANGKVKPSPETLQRIMEATHGQVQPNDFFESVGAPAGESVLPSMEGMRLGVDIGGTFTDLILLDRDGANSRVEKVATTPANLAIGVLDGLDRLGVSGAALDMIVHGTTVGLNAFLEKKGAPTGIITTAGFRDVYEIGRHNRVEMYDLFYLKPKPLVQRRNRLGVRERIDADGNVQAPLAKEDVLSCVQHFRQVGIKSIAVCLLNSYLNPVHEEMVREIIEQQYPEATVTISSSLVRQWREYERTSTCAVNAYIMPVVGQYLDDLEKGLAERSYRKPLFVSQSAGGLISVNSARNKPVHTIMSGPSGGVVAANHISAALGRKNVITFDMGGTSTDVALIHDGKINLAGEASLDRHPLLVPMIDIKSIGAGGGSIARVTPTGALEVGPESAGAIPGPICYGRGGDDPTVTDANLLLGCLPAQHFLGGSMILDATNAIAALEQKIAVPLGLNIGQAAAGIIDVINAKMAYAVRAITIERGLDPKEFSLLPFGGAGPMHACAVARYLGIPEVIIPVSPGTFSAFGMLVSDIRHDFVRTLLTRIDGDNSLATVEQTFATMTAEAEATLTAEGVTRGNMVFERALDIRYVGQEYTVSLPLASQRVDQTTMIGVCHRFHRLHERQYGHSSQDEPLELVDLRLAAHGLISKLDRNEIAAGSSSIPAEAVLGDAETLFSSNTGMLRTPLLSRDLLLAGNVFEGPAIVVEQTATTFIEPGFQAQVMPTGEILLSLED